MVPLALLMPEKYTAMYVYIYSRFPFGMLVA